MDEVVKVNRKEKIVFVILNRPDKKNALNPEIHLKMNEILDDLKKDRDVRVLVMTGSGDSFCTGMDLEECLLDGRTDPMKWEQIMESTAEWMNKLKSFPKPTIASINGWCIGGGLVLVAACDLAIASEKAIFGLSEINFGSLPAGGATWSVAYSLPPKHAMYLILTGNTISAKEAERIGFINKAVPHEKLEDEVINLCTTLCEKDPFALMVSKEAYRKSRIMEYRDAAEWEFAKVDRLSYLQQNEWREKGLKQFKGRKYKPALESYKK